MRVGSRGGQRGTAEAGEQGEWQEREAGPDREGPHGPWKGVSVPFSPEGKMR